MERMFVNQPSTNQDFHHIHGLNVIADYKPNEHSSRCWPVKGEVISLQIPNICLSKGWTK